MSENKEPVPEEFQSLEEIQAFWDSHTTADYQNEMLDADVELSPELKSKLELKKLYRILGLSPQQIVTIEARSRQESKDSKALLRAWILEHV